MHESAMKFAATALAEADVRGKRVVESGAYNYNGTVRPEIEAMLPASYLATDAQAGPGVDLACPAQDLAAALGAGTADVVISTEMLEHAEDWHGALAGIAAVMAPGGLLILTTRGPGFVYHPHPGDFWRFTVEVMGAALAACGLDVLRCEPDPQVPGVFVLARKPAEGQGADLAALAALEAGPPR